MKTRLFLIILSFLFRKERFTSTSESVLYFRVMPWDCVIRLVGNDRYHAFMDAGSLDLAIRLGWWRSILKNRWNPFVITVYIRHCCSLKLFQRFALHTRIIHLDKRFVWLEHIFERNGKVVATAISKNAATGKKGIVPVKYEFHLPNRAYSSKSRNISLIDAMGPLLRKIGIRE